MRHRRTLSICRKLDGTWQGLARQRRTRTVTISGAMKVHLHRETWKLRRPFRFTGRAIDHCDLVVVELREGSIIGRGEAKGVHYLDDTAEHVHAQIDSVAERVERGVTREELQKLLPPGGARNALDSGGEARRGREASRPLI